MNKEIITFTVKPRRGDPITWHLGMPTINEDNQYSQRFTQIADKEGEAKAEAEYKIYVDALTKWSERMPTRKMTVKSEPDEDGKVTETIEEVPLGEGNITEAITSYFAEKTAPKEWMAYMSISSFRNSLYPAVDFQEHSE